MSSLRWISISCLALAFVLWIVERFVSFGFAVVVAPGVHRDIWPNGIVFWGLLAVGVLLTVVSLLRQVR